MKSRKIEVFAVSMTILRCCTAREGLIRSVTHPGSIAGRV
jgi:hypothetical protein